MEDLLRQTIKLRLLTLVLAVVLTWYAMNPAPGPVRKVRRDDKQPDEKRREARRPRLNYQPVRIEADAFKSTIDSLSSPTEDVDDLEWPEVIYVR